MSHYFGFHSFCLHCQDCGRFLLKLNTYHSRYIFLFIYLSRSLINEERKSKILVSVYLIHASGQVWSIVAVGMHFTVSLPLEGF